MDSVNGSTKLRSPGVEGTINSKTSITCTNVPESLFDANAAKKHFSKFGRVQKIRLYPKRQMCIIEYDQPMSVGRAMLNAGAYDGFMFEVARFKARVRKRSKKEDDPDWVPDSDVEEELLAMRGGPSKRVLRQTLMDVDGKVVTPKKVLRATKQSPVKKNTPVRVKPTIMFQTSSEIEPPVMVPTTQTTMSTSQAAAELHQLRSRVSHTPDEQWRTLDARDRILRSWGGAGSRVKIGGATIGTCPDMCPEKELLHRQAEYQVMTLETVVDSDGQLDPKRAVKQYSRSSADQEIPMCYELRPAPILMQTCAYLLHEIADTTRQVSLADWFHFMWDRLRGIRKDITQQALCCAESIKLVEMCARFHAHCAARLADLEHTQFDQKLNTDNLTKCLQTLKHMYADVDTEQKPNEAVFRGYIALLNLGDANFWWEIKQLPLAIQKSQDITFAMKVFNALDNNNYVRFFRLVKHKASYLQACILLRYFNDVRARALARIVKAFAPRGGSRYPTDELMNALAFESLESMKSFINHYGLRFAKTDDTEHTVVLDRNKFIEDSDPYPTARALTLIESKRQNSVGEIISGGSLPKFDFENRNLYSSFNKDGKLKETALIAEDQGYNTVNDSNKDLRALKSEIQRLYLGGRSIDNTERLTESRTNLFAKPESKQLPQVTATNEERDNRSFSFNPAIPVASKDIIKNSPEKIFNDTKNIFSFSKPQPQDSMGNDKVFSMDTSTNIFKPPMAKSLFDGSTDDTTQLAIFDNVKKDTGVKNLFKGINSDTALLKKPDAGKSIFNQVSKDSTQKPGLFSSNNIFREVLNKQENKEEGQSKNIIFKVSNEFHFAKPNVENEPNIFAKPMVKGSDSSNSIFGSFKSNVFSQPNQTVTNIEHDLNKSKSIFGMTPNGDATKVSPGSLFKSAYNQSHEPTSKPYSIFQSKNKAPSVADNIFNSINVPNNNVYEFDDDNNLDEKSEEEKIQEETLRKEKLRLEQAKRQELERKEEKLKEEARKKQEELKLLDEKRRRDEERKQEELKKLEEEKKAELKKKAEEEAKKFKDFVEKESLKLLEELINEINDETIKNIMNEEAEKLEALVTYAGSITDELLTEVCNEICVSETTAEKFWSEKLMRKWFFIWRKQFIRNVKRRNLLKDTPVWLTDKTPTEEAFCLRRGIESSILHNMNAIHRGYKFELKPLSPPNPIKIMETVKSSLLKRMKQINYPYDKCIFWKFTLVSPGSANWLCRKIDIDKWLLTVFGDDKRHEISDSLIKVGKWSWNNLMDFAISVSLTSKESTYNCGEAVEGTNGLLFYATENDHDLISILEETLKQRYPYQIIPIAIVMPKNNALFHNLDAYLSNLIQNKNISAYKIFVLDSQNIFQSLHSMSKSALKWLAKNFSQNPPLEIDYLKSICQRYLGSEIWCQIRTDTDYRMPLIMKDIQKLVKCYNVAVDKLTAVITNEDLFNYPSFPLEFKVYLDSALPYPKAYEFIPSSVKNSANISRIKDIMKQLKLPNPVANFHPASVTNMHDGIRKYCKQIGWFENLEEIVCKVVAVLPNELSDETMSQELYNKYFEQYDFVHFLNIIVYEKICKINDFNNCYAIYEKSALQDYRNSYWLHESDVLSTKHKAIDYNDELDWFIEAKRRKLDDDSLDYLMLEDKDCTMVEENIKAADVSIAKYSNCKEAVEQLEKELEEKSKKSMELENLLKTALADI